MIIKEERAIDIDYRILAKYHVNAEMIWGIRNENNQCPQTTYNFFKTFDFEDLNELEDCEHEAQELYEMLVRVLDICRISEHHGNLFYIIINHLELEGSIYRDYSGSEKWAKSKLTPLLRLLKIRDADISNGIRIEFSHKNLSNKSFPEYTSIDDLSTVDKLLESVITTMFQDIKTESLNVNPVLSFILEDIATPTYDNINGLVGDLSAVSKKAFDSSLLYTITSEVARYLTIETDMNPKGSGLTNNQARVIYILLVYFELINKENHDTDLEMTRYIRSILDNNLRENKPLLKFTIDQAGSARLNNTKMI